jgi:hypothetical protein
MFEFVAIPRIVVGVTTALIGLPILLWLLRDQQRRRPDAPFWATAIAAFLAGGVGTFALAGMILVPLELILRFFR